MLETPFCFEIDEFAQLVGVWRWRGIDVGLLRMYRRGHLRAASLMLADRQLCAARHIEQVLHQALNAVLSSSQLAEFQFTTRPTLVTLCTGRQDSMGYLLGMIVMAALCGLGDEPR